MSARSPSATWASTSPVAGLRLGKVFPDTASTHRPSISIRFGPPSRNAGRAWVFVVAGVGDGPRRDYPAEPRSPPLPSSLASHESALPVARERNDGSLAALLAGQPLLGSMDPPASPAPQLQVVDDRPASDPRGQLGPDGVRRVHAPQRRAHQGPAHVVPERRLVLLRCQAVTPEVRVG